MLGGRTDALSVYLLWMQAEIKSTNSITLVEPMVKKISTGAMDCNDPKNSPNKSHANFFSKLFFVVELENLLKPEP